MIRETVSDLTPEGVIEEARRFFTDEDAAMPATVVEESPRSVTLSTFRSRLAISAFPDPDGNGTRVRISTLRRNDAVGKFVSLVSRAIAGSGGAGGG
jgi:hypothetical protein